ncbi:MAG: electron transport complex subunit RsxC [Candidatus Brocadiae bacterium]|nr:electron transport complex subunit RsxC [Candidatus Brocadiia bacterium]
MRTFPGGFHPHDHKERSKGQAIRCLPVPAQVVLPMVQHIGVPCVPTVKKGDAVCLGQVVGTPDPENPRRFVSARVHASVSGEVVAVEPRPHPFGSPVLSVVLQNDGQDTWVDGLLDETDPGGLDAAAIKDRIQAAGIVGMGGAAFPTHVKLSPPPDKPIDTVILNGAECEPYLTCDYRLMLEQAEEIVEGLQLIARTVDAKHLYIGIEANKRDAADVLRRAAEGTGIAVELCRVKYPQGAEKQLIVALTGRRVPAVGLPLEVGVVVHNVATALAIRQAACSNRPLVDRVLTVAGDGVKRPANLRVRLGTPIRHVLDDARPRDGVRKIVLGGPMMGLAQHRTDVPVIKGTSGVLALRAAPTHTWRACISCGRCVDACPMNLLPNEISIACEARDVDAIAATTILDCFECGGCAYVCPAKRPIVHWVKFGKAELAKRRAEQQARQAAG